MHMKIPDIFSRAPDIRLTGAVSDSMADHFSAAAEKLAAEKEGPWLVELSTLGGDADAARRIACELRLLRETQGRDIYFLGKACVYSAGVTVMTGFAKDRRWLARGTALLVHERSITETLELKGKPVSFCRQALRNLSAQLDAADRLQQEGFAALAADFLLDAAEIAQRAAACWYLDANDAVEYGFAQGLV